MRIDKNWQDSFIGVVQLSVHVCFYASRDGVSFEDGLRNPPLAAFPDDEARAFRASLLLADADNTSCSMLLLGLAISSSPLPVPGIFGIET
mmetsp:Transcript_36760/g.68142  ORF Transcript_36760/g.68142 Transcript_36760/m.68142 type:complete len:91 (+) Transcript_36760:365-637(+)